ncbi:MAG TPA: Npun_F0494 family protein [Crinalium sp.]|jgi:hypothetical protein
MTSVNPTSTQSAHYDRRTLERAERAVRCAPFQLRLFNVMCSQGVELKAIAAEAGIRNGYTKRPIPELTTESELLWLIEVGLLRREVDGQGLTDSFRLTPLGRHLVEKWQHSRPFSSPTWLDQLRNAQVRWLRLPSWL